MKKYALIISIFLTGFLFAETINVPKDYSNIADAINAAQNGDTIKIAAGSFNEQLFITKELTLIGSGTSKTKIYFSHKGDSETSALKATPVIKIQTDARVRIENLSIGGDELKSSKPEKTDYGIVSKSSDLLLSNISINNIRITGVWSQEGSIDCDYLTVKNSTGSLMSHAVFIEDASSISISNSKFETYSGFGFYSENVNTIFLENDIFISEAADSDIFVKGNTRLQADSLLIDGKETFAALQLENGVQDVYLQSSNILNHKSAFHINNNIEFPVKIVIDNTRLNNLSASGITVAGPGRLELDLGDGLHESTGGNSYNSSAVPVVALSEDYDVQIFSDFEIPIAVNVDTTDDDNTSSIDITAVDTEVVTDTDISTVVIETENSNVEVSDEKVISAATEAGAQIVSLVEAERGSRFAPRNPVRTEISDFSVLVIKPNGDIHEIDVQPLLPEQAVATENSTWIVYKNHREEQYLGYYDNEYKFKQEFPLLNLDVHDIAVDDIKAAVYYSSEYGHYVGLFSKDMLFAGEFKFHNDIDILDIHIRGREVWVHYKYPMHGEYMGRFDTSMRFINEQKLYK